MPVLPQVIIIGGGFAGLAAARRLKHVACEVTLIDRFNHHVFQPLLYQVATAGLSPGDIASPIRWILRKQPRLRVLLATVEHIDSASKTITLDGGDTLRYDYLIVAAGATHSYFGHDEWATAAPGLKTLDDALAIRRRLLIAFEEAERETNPVYQRRLLTYVLIGGGPTGVEMAGALGEIARQALRSEFDNVDPAIARIILVEAGPSILPAFPEDLRSSARKALRRLGVEVRDGQPVTRVEDGAVWIGEERIDAHTILWAAGVAAAPISRDLGPTLDRAWRVIVEPDLSAPGHPGVFVAGDLASFYTRPASRCLAWRRWPSSSAATPPPTSRDLSRGSPPPRSVTSTPGTWPPSGAMRPLRTSASCTCPATQDGCSGSSSTSCS